MDGGLCGELGNGKLQKNRRRKCKYVLVDIQYVSNSQIIP